jgi:hypothetical protein
MRHIPSIGALPIPDRAELFLVVKQDTAGICFVVSNASMDWLLADCSRHTEVADRRVGAWTHTILADVPDDNPPHDLPSTPALPFEHPF